MEPRRSRPRISTFLIAGLLAASALPVLADGEHGVIEITVLSPAGDPATDARVTLIELKRAEFVDENGRCAFEDVHAGSYHLLAESDRFGSQVLEIDVVEGETHRHEIRVGTSKHREQIVVTATRSGRGSAEMVLPVEVLDRTELSEKMKATLGETLADEPGVSSTYFGPGSSRPIIRGQGGGRVQVLEGGLGVGDVSTTSPDHAVASDTLNAERIEILRGPSALLYGTTAVGGLVNMIDGRIPDHVPQRKVGGELDVRVGSVADEQAGALMLGGGVGGFAWYVDAVKRETDDYSIPGPAVVGDPSTDTGTLPNSSMESESATVGGSAVLERGFLGASVRTFDTNYGIPADLENVGEPEVRIDMEQNRYDLRGGFDLNGWLNGLTFSVGVVDYEHAELDAGAIATQFFNDATEARFELTHRDDSGRHNAVFGFQAAGRELEAVGAEAFIPPNETDALGVFTLQEFKPGALRYEFGLRYDRTDHSTPATIAADPVCRDPLDRDFAGLSGSVGAVWVEQDRYSIGASLSATERSPTAEELYSCGEHVATQSFEIGDPDLQAETSVGVDLSLRKRKGRVTGELNLYYNDYGDYIFEFDTGMIVDGLPALRFAQSDADFYGFEISGLVELLHTDEHDLDLQFIGDAVRGELANGDYLPRIPASTLGLGLQYQGSKWSASAGVRRTDDQTRTAPNELPTPGYTMVDASVGYRFITRGLAHHLMLRGTNLTDEEARPATSRLKLFVPLPGRDITAIYRLLF